MAVATNIFPLVRRVKLVSTMPRLVRNDLHENLCSRCSHFRHRDPARQLFPLAWTKVGQSGSNVAGRALVAGTTARQDFYVGSLKHFFNKEVPFTRGCTQKTLIQKLMAPILRLYEDK